VSSRKTWTCDLFFVVGQDYYMGKTRRILEQDILKLHKVTVLWILNLYDTPGVLAAVDLFSINVVDTVAADGSKGQERLDLMISVFIGK